MGKGVANYYVTVIDAGRVGILAGPFETHQEALAMVEPARIKACELNAYAWFYAFGTSKIVSTKPGLLNRELEVL